jgi:MarR family 2-MHQ and catechol resistance regulon transcriptional repressor
MDSGKPVDRSSGMPRDGARATVVFSPKHRASPEQLWVAIARCYRTMNALLERSFQDAGLSLSDFMLLEALLHKGPMTITEIQDAILLATGSMTAIVDRLESRGWIARTFSERDRRARVLQLTAEGKIVISAAYEEHKQQLKRWMAVVSPDERSLTFGSLRKLEKQLRAADLHGPL